MQFFAYAIAVWSIIILCGLPFALILLPPKLRPLALGMAPTFGYCYIVYSGYLLYRSDIGGTDLYWPLIICIPVSLLAWLAWRRRILSSLIFGEHAISMLLCAALSFAALSSFYMLANGRAVSMAISNLDIAELASVSRYLQEFARNTTIGFMGQSGHFLVTGDEIWFGPSLIAAFMSSVTFSDPFRLQSLAMAVVASQGAAFVYIIVKDTLSLDRRIAFGVALLYATSPVVAFVVWQSFGGQMLATSLMLAITYLVTRALTEAADVKAQFLYLPSIVLLLSGLLETYHFMVGIICGLLAIYVMIVAACEISLRRLSVGAALLISAVALTVLFNPLRIPGIVANVPMLLSSNGWFIPWLSPDVQLGLNAADVLTGDTQITTYRILAILIVVALALATALHLIRIKKQPAHIAFVLGLAAPVFLLGLFFAVREHENGILGSYRSFKITASFSAFILIGLSLWMGGAARNRRLPWRAIGLLVGLILIIANVVSLGALVSISREMAFLPPEHLRQIQKIKSMDNVTGISIMRDDSFDMFWAHYFTLKKRQFFQSFPYGGRAAGVVTERYRLQPVPSASTSGDIFVLNDGYCRKSSPVTARVQLCDLENDFNVSIAPGDGWWDEEHGEGQAWRWSGKNGRYADVIIETATPGSEVIIKASYGALRSGNSISMTVNGGPVAAQMTETSLVSQPIRLDRTRNFLRFTEALDPEPAKQPDSRMLGVLWKRISIEPGDGQRDPNAHFGSVHYGFDAAVDAFPNPGELLQSTTE